MVCPLPIRPARTVEPAPVHEETGREFLAFTMGGEEYGLDILTVREIRGDEAVTRAALAA